MLLNLKRAGLHAVSALRELRPLCARVLVAGSIRREKPEGIKDADLVVLPKRGEEEALFDLLRERGYAGGSVKLVKEVEDGFKVEVNIAESLEEWGSQILHHTGSKENNIRMRIVARKRGLRLSQHGLFDADGERVAGRTEESVYLALGLPFQEPGER